MGVNHESLPQPIVPARLSRAIDTRIDHCSYTVECRCAQHHSGGRAGDCASRLAPRLNWTEQLAGKLALRISGA